ncbi:MAG: hypothetical protein RMJ66_00310 [Bacteroidia bacterium]|nr:hypothetical protein [Bacteroidia bacterium]MDW8133486.1 hypothetical protein [Bacteroidia bacterium]
MVQDFSEDSGGILACSVVGKEHQTRIFSVLIRQLLQAVSLSNLLRVKCIEDITLFLREPFYHVCGGARGST